jgi:hypothetical protein
MRTARATFFAILSLALAALLLPAQPLRAHGSVTPDDDLCIIRIGYYQAHVKIYQPLTREQRDYCEDLPDTGDSIFVMEYEHEGLAETPIDFRIIRNVTGIGQFAKLQDVQRIEDLDAVTVFHHPAAVQRDVFTVAHRFAEAGEFIGIVTVQNPDTGKAYNAVFPFEVGYFGLGFWPWIAAAVLLLQCQYLWMSGWWRRWRRRRAGRPEPAFAAILLTAVLAGQDAAQAGNNDDMQAWPSRSGHFRVTYSSNLKPLRINHMHNWRLHIETGAGEPVLDADVSIDGGMPIHDHGLPTRPRLTAELGNGDYLFEGMRFHMNGLWEIEVTVSSQGLTDVVTIPLQL